jgi:hypothetical protein
VASRDGMVQLSIRVPEDLADAFNDECVEKETNKTVLLSKILSRRYRIPYKPSAISARRRTPHGGGSGRPR